MKFVTTPQIEGSRITETLGMARGSTVRAKHVGTDIVSSLKSLVGGEMTGYSSLMAGAREQAIDRMLENAREIGADAVVSVRFETAGIMGKAAEVLAYGTAVKLALTE